MLPPSLTSHFLFAHPASPLAYLVFLVATPSFPPVALHSFPPVAHPSVRSIARPQYLTFPVSFPLVSPLRFPLISPPFTHPLFSHLLTLISLLSLTPHPPRHSTFISPFPLTIHFPRHSPVDPSRSPRCAPRIPPFPRPSFPEFAHPIIELPMHTHLLYFHSHSDLPLPPPTVLPLLPSPLPLSLPSHFPRFSSLIPSHPTSPRPSHFPPSHSTSPRPSHFPPSAPLHTPVISLPFSGLAQSVPSFQEQIKESIPSQPLQQPLALFPPCLPTVPAALAAHYQRDYPLSHLP
ncbi:unnamed protein product [Closterium sp. Naga37s-1]|nr:unnamed protein product [Closterium sp. Naga37s-1]